MANRVTAACLGGVMAASLLTAVSPSMAMADVQDTDVIFGKTIAERSLNHEYAPSILAPAATLVDTDGNVYFERNSDQERKIASTTKLMTALIAIENGTPEDIINVTDQDVVIGSSAQLQAGDQLTLDHALYGLLLPSGNDAAMAIARTIGARFAQDGGDPYVAFIDKMNARAKELGMSHTIYRNPSGLDWEEWDGDQHSTANDLAILMEACLKMEDPDKAHWIREIMKTGMYDITVTNNGVQRQIHLDSTDELVGSSEEFIGGKTGQTDQAGSCFVGALEHDDKTYISVVLGEQAKESAFNDTRELFTWVVAHERAYELDENDGTMTDDGKPIIAEIPHAEWIDVTIPLTIETEKSKVHAFDLNGEIEQKAHFEVARGDISKGDVLGAIELRQNDEVIDTLNLVATEDCPRPSMLRGLFIGVERFFRNLHGEPIVAEQVSHFGGSTVDNDSDEAKADESKTGESTTTDGSATGEPAAETTQTSTPEAPAQDSVAQGGEIVATV